MVDGAVFEADLSLAGEGDDVLAARGDVPIAEEAGLAPSHKPIRQNPQPCSRRQQTNPSADKLAVVGGVDR